MQYTYLGRSGLSVSRLCLGTMNFGPQTDEPTAHLIMDSAREAGINFFAWLLAQPAVTAPVVGPRNPAQLAAALGALDVDLDAATLNRLDEIFPGHQSAPEDYAW